MKRLADDYAGVRVTGRVDDVRPFVREAAVYIVPLRIGGGTRLKIFEAMAMGKAVVSTSIGAEGLPIADETHAMLADGPTAFARAILGLMRDPDRRASLEAAARALVVERYDWSAVAGHMEEALQAIADCGLRIADCPMRIDERPVAVITNQAVIAESAISNRSAVDRSAIRNQSAIRNPQSAM